MDSSAKEAGGSKVDAIWQQLKGAHAPARRPAQAVNVDALLHGARSDLPGKKAVPKQPVQPTYEGELIYRARPAPAPAAAGGGAAASSSTAPTQPSPEVAQQLITRCIAGLKDSNQGVRRKALQDIKASLVDNPQLGEEWLAERLEGDGLAKALLRRFDDPPDTCREMAVTSLLALLQAAPQAVLSLLPYTVPVLGERLLPREEGSKNLAEPCEEVRLALAQLLRCLVTLGGKSIAAYAGEVVEVVAALCEDPFHEVQEEACGAVLALNEALGPRLHPVSKQLVAALLPLTTAKRHRVRVAALKALKPTMHQGAHEMILEMVAWRDPNVIPIKAFYGDDLKVNFCGKLASDPHPAVRREFLSVLADWMTGLRERLDHEPRLLPFVLSALNDEVPEIQEDAVGLLERLGVQYEKDHEKELKETLPYLPEEAHGIGWQAAGAAGFVYGAAQHGEETVNGGRTVMVLPGPLRARPRLGTRRLVQSNFSRIVGALAEELTGWLLEARRRTAALLRTQLVLVEEWSEQHLHLLMPALVKAITDPEVRPAVRDCCAIIGAFTDPELALQLLGPRVGDEAADVGQRAAALEVLACVARGAGPRRALDAHLGSVLALLSLEPLLVSEDTRVRRAMQDVVEQLVDTCGPACDRHAQDLLWVCLHLRAPKRAALAATAVNPPAAASLSAIAGGAAAGALGGAGAAGALVAGAHSAAAMVAEAGDGGTASAAASDGVEALMQRLAVVVGCAGGVDELVEVHRAALLARVDPGASANVQLVAGALCRLMLPYARQSYLLYGPEELQGRVLPPDACPPASLLLLPPHGAGAGGMEVDGAARAGGGSDGDAAEGGWCWQPCSTAALARQLGRQLGWMPNQARAAAACTLCLEACLEALPAQQEAGAGGGVAGGGAGAAGMEVDGGSQGAGASAAEAEAEVLGVLEQLLGSCQELPPHVLLGALRCVHAVVRRRLAGRGGAALTRRLAEVAQGVAGCMGVAASAACRLQACWVLQLLLQGLGGGQAGSGGGEVQAVLGAACPAVAARLYDAADEVRCAALRLARQVVQGLGGAGAGGQGGAEALVVGLLKEVAQLRDVSPGSAFYDEYGAFRAWAAGSAGSLWTAAGGQ